MGKHLKKATAKRDARYNAAQATKAARMKNSNGMGGAGSYVDSKTAGAVNMPGSMKR